MKLQLALDVFSLEEALKIAYEVRDYIDIIEIGTPFVLEYGMEAVRRFRAAFPEKEILADVKIMDAGRLEVTSAIKAGADYITVLAVTDKLTIQECVATANAYGKKICVDLICIPDIEKETKELEALGVHGIAVHTGVDQQKAGRTPLQDLAILKKAASTAEVSVAGGISLATMKDYALLKPDIVIVGGAIGSAPDPVAAAKAISEEMHRYEGR